MMTQQRVQIPDLRFSPTDAELINILSKRVKTSTRNHYITETETMYEKEPWLIQHVTHVSHKDINEWFYFVRRKRRLGVTNHNATTPSRKVVGSSGRWKSNGSLTKIDNKNNVTIGYKQQIAFMVKKQETEKSEKATGWVMHEYRLNEPGFQQVVLCRIRFNKRRNNAQYSPMLESIVIGQTLDDEDGSALVKYNNLDHANTMGQEFLFGDIASGQQNHIHNPRWSQAMEQQHTYNSQLPTMMNQTMEEEENNSLSYFEQNIDLHMVPMETQQHGNNVGQQAIEEAQAIEEEQALDEEQAIKEAQAMEEQQAIDEEQAIKEAHAIEEEQAMEEQQATEKEDDFDYDVEIDKEKWYESMATTSTYEAYLELYKHLPWIDF
ncbi:unnamed protein product [Cochlearia groenlandica]